MTLQILEEQVNKLLKACWQERTCSKVDYALAKPLLEAIINSGEFNAWKAIPYIENFREEREFNAESLFEVAFSYDFGGSSWDGTGQGTQTEVTFRGQEYGPNAWRNVIPSVSLVE